MAADKNSKKANLLEHHSIKHILDESVAEIVKSKGYPEDLRMSNIRLLIGAIIIIIALFAQFYIKKFPDNRNFLLGCIGLYHFRGVIFFLIRCVVSGICFCLMIMLWWNAFFVIGNWFSRIFEIVGTMVYGHGSARRTGSSVVVPLIPQGNSRFPDKVPG